MSYQIIKNLRTEGGKIKCEMCSNNVSPKNYYKWEREDTDETRDMVRGFLRQRVWQPQNDRANDFICSLNVNAYEDGQLTPWAQEMKRTAKGKSYWQETGVYQQEYDVLWGKLVPLEGKAATVNGELLRTSSKLYYDFFNNGNINACEQVMVPNYGDQDEDYEDEYETKVSDYYQECIDYIKCTCKQDYELQGLLGRIESIIPEGEYGCNDADNEHTYDLMVDHVLYWVLTHEDKAL